MKHRYILLVVLVLFLLCGCDAPEPNGPAELWIVTEKTDRFGMNDQAEKLITRFEEAHDDVTIRLETIPTDKEKRDAYLEQLRTAIMAGEGPDAYLLPVKPYGAAEQLFTDVTQSMYNGIFCDIGRFYDTDEELNTDGLVAAVMDAGTIGDARYVLPLRYDFPVAYVDESQWAETGLSSDLFAQGITELWDAVGSSGDQKLANGTSLFPTDILMYATNFFPGLIDYEAQELILTAEEVERMMDAYRELLTVRGACDGYLGSYLGMFVNGYYWAESGHSAYIASMSDAMLNTAYAQVQGIDLSVYPVASLDGTVVADVTYYCAVGAGCDYPELAYAYLRMFLTEEAQWEDIRRDTSGYSYEGLIARGWPVRAVGGTEKLWIIIKNQFSELRYEDAAANARLKKVRRIWLTDEDLPILQTEIDSARFSMEAESDLAMILYGELNDAEEGYLPSETDTHALAEEFVANLRWHVAEG